LWLIEIDVFQLPQLHKHLIVSSNHMTPKLQDFIRILTERSSENTASILLLHGQRLYGTSISLLRQELDSLIRVCYLHTLTSPAEIDRLIDDTISGVEWEKNGKRITDRKMVNIASQYNHWAPEVYEFGNCFTHLTNYHDYKTNDPVNNLDTATKQTIKGYLHSYHQFPATKDATFENVIPYIPEVARKVSNNMRSYLNNLSSRP
jgi:hypothetical protein